MWHTKDFRVLWTTSFTNNLSLLKDNQFLRKMLAIYGFHSENIVWKKLYTKKTCNFEPFCFIINWEENYVNKECNLFNPYFLLVMLSMHFNKLPLISTFCWGHTIYCLHFQIPLKNSIVTRQNRTYFQKKKVGVDPRVDYNLNFKGAGQTG